MCSPCSRFVFYYASKEISWCLFLKIIKTMILKQHNLPSRYLDDFFYEVYISQLIRFVRVRSYVNDFNAKNKC